MNQTTINILIFVGFIISATIITYIIVKRQDKRYDETRSRKMRTLFDYMSTIKNDWSGHCSMPSDNQTLVYTYGDLNIVVCSVIADDKYHGSVYTKSLLNSDWSFETDNIVVVGKIIKAYSILLAR